MRYKKDITMEDAKVLMQKNEKINGINRATDTTTS
jgi:hypothetical protein